ncbi:hypothetical protein KNHN1_16260 [Pseudomonas guariconensis]
MAMAKAAVNRPPATRTTNATPQAGSASRNMPSTFARTPHFDIKQSHHVSVLRIVGPFASVIAIGH